MGKRDRGLRLSGNMLCTWLLYAGYRPIIFYRYPLSHMDMFKRDWVTMLYLKKLANKYAGRF
jgi:hypothetical protein